MATRLCLLLVLCVYHVEGGPPKFSMDENTKCLSRFDYDYKVLQQLLLLEEIQEDFKRAMKQQSEALEEVNGKRQADYEQLNNQLTELQIKHRTLANRVPDQGSTYIRWGRTSCPDNGTAFVYEGYAGGSMFDHRGGAANYICLPKEPLWGEYEDFTQSGAEIYGAEYQLDGRNIPNFFQQSLRDSDVPCVVCRTIRPSVMMVPGRNQCYSGWTMEYSGYLTAGHSSHSATEFVCLDGQPEVIKDSAKNDNGKLFYFAEARCGSLKCPPYVNGRELTCAVCTK